METTPAVRKTDLAQELVGVPPGQVLNFDQLFRFAQVCHASGLFEDVKDAAQAFVKIAKGAELGMAPMTAMASFDIIRGRLYIKPWAIAAKINTCGYGGYRVMEQTAEQCTIVFRRKYPQQGWMDLTPVTYTLDEAKAQDLIGNSKHWKASPANMLYQRAMGRGGAQYFPELLAGLEPPREDTQPEAQHLRATIADLFGDDSRGSTPTPPVALVDSTTVEVVPIEAETPVPLAQAHTPPAAVL